MSDVKNLFLDSNIWLSLYSLSSDDLSQFGKLKEQVGTEICLWVPQQVCDEVYRNREGKIKQALKKFEIKPLQVPVFCKGYDEYEGFSRDYQSLEIRYKEWMRRVDRDIKMKNLPADKTISELFSVARILPCSEYENRAFKRYIKGNPPGKDNKYGDAIIWECLLSEVPNNEDLYFISMDKDYRSEISDNALNPFLENEWETQKESSLVFYKNLVSFLSKHFKDIQLRDEQEKEREKEALIVALKNSQSFYETHAIIGKMSQFSEWSAEQVEEICSACETNDQIRNIILDRDIFTFYLSLLSVERYTSISDGATKRLMEYFFADILFE